MHIAQIQGMLFCSLLLLTLFSVVLGDSSCSPSIVVASPQNGDTIRKFERDANFGVQPIVQIEFKADVCPGHYSHSILAELEWVLLVNGKESKLPLPQDSGMLNMGAALSYGKHTVASRVVEKATGRIIKKHEVQFTVVTPGWYQEIVLGAKPDQILEVTLIGATMKKKSSYTLKNAIQGYVDGLSAFDHALLPQDVDLCALADDDIPDGTFMEVTYNMKQFQRSLFSEDNAVEDNLIMFPGLSEKFTLRQRIYNCKLGFNTRLAILLHLHHDALWNEEIFPMIKKSKIFETPGVEADLWVNVITASAKQKVLKDAPEARVIVSDNRGRDIGGFFQLLMATNGANADNPYGIYLFLHTKSDEAQRTALMGSMLEPKAWKRSLNILGCRPDVGAVASRRDSSETWSTGHTAITPGYLLPMMSFQLGLVPQMHSPFMSGTMFYARASIFDQFFSNNGPFPASEISKQFVSEGAPSVEALLPFIWERLLGYIVTSKSYFIVNI